MSDIIYGINPVEMALKHHKVNRIYSDLKDDHPVIKLAKEKNIKISKLNNFKDKEYGDVKNNQKIIAIIEKYRYWNISDVYKSDPQNILFLDQIKDPQNFGAIIRSAAAFGIEYILIPSSNSVEVTEVVHKASAGNTFLVKIVKINALVNIIKKLKQNNYWVVSFALSNNNIKFNDLTKLDSKFLLIVGSEEKGIRENILKQSDYISKIEMSSNVESLNVSVSTGIILYSFFAKK